MKMTHGSLFSGIGGFDIASQWCGWTNVFQCEINPFCQRVLKYHFPKTILYDDIKQTDFIIHRGTISVLSGGFPCQPFSIAGKRKGTADDRFLWDEMFRAILEVKPSWVVAENVYGLLSQERGMVFEHMCADLESAGYEVQPLVIPACAVGAPHRRDRVWIVAHSNSMGCENVKKEYGKSVCNKKSNYQVEKQEWVEQQCRISECDTIVTNATNTGIESVQQERKNQICVFETIADTDGARHERRQPIRQSKRFEQNAQERIASNADNVGRKKNNKIEQSIVFAQDIQDWRNFPTQSPVCGGNDGLPGILDGITFPSWRRKSIEAYGNAIVPKVAYQIFKAINEINYGSSS
jgi:DNA (cytosine-5)-methyltransferase 1